jgi:hypothetical protein
VRHRAGISCQTILDGEGVEAADLDEALTEARSVVAETADEVIEADPGRPWTLIVRDDAGSIWLAYRSTVETAIGDNAWQS